MMKINTFPGDLTHTSASTKSLAGTVLYSTVVFEGLHTITRDANDSACAGNMHMPYQQHWIIPLLAGQKSTVQNFLTRLQEAVVFRTAPGIFTARRFIRA